MNVKGIIDMDGSNIGARNTNWVVKDRDISDSSSIGSISEDSMNSVSSSNSESELAEDASTSASSSSSHSNGPLYELSELMNHLPIKRGLSIYYQGKAQSFTSLAMVQSIEDLPKKEYGFRKKMKSCKNFGGGLDGHRVSYTTTPKATISKKANSRGSFVSVLNKRGSFHGESTLSSISVHKNF